MSVLRAATATLIAACLIGVMILTPTTPNGGLELGSVKPVQAAPQAGFVRHIGTASATTQGTSLALTVGGPGVVNGNTVVVAFATSGSPTGLLCNDSAGNNYLFDIGLAFSGPFTPPLVFVCAANNVQGLTATSTITVSSDVPGVINRVMTVAEFSGIDFLPPNNSANVGYEGGGSQGVPSANMTTAGLTTLNPHVLLIGAFAVGGGAADPFTADPLYTAIPGAGTTSGVNDVSIRAEYRVVAATGTYSATGTIGPPPTNRNWAGVVFGLKALPPSPTATATATRTPTPPSTSTATPTPSSTSTATPTATGSATITSTPTRTPTSTATPIVQGGITLVNPTRVFDSRVNAGGPIGFLPNGSPYPGGPISGSLPIQLAGRTFGSLTLPNDLTAVLVNVTTLGAPSGSWVTLTAGDVHSPPNVSTVNSNLATNQSFWATAVETSPIGFGQPQRSVIFPPAPGSVVIHHAGGGSPRHVIIDLVGYTSASTVSTLGNLRFITPVRVLDTRGPTFGGPIGVQGDGSPVPVGPVTPMTINRYRVAGQTFGGHAFPATVSGIIAQVTALQAGPSTSFTTITPGDFVGVPGAATLNQSQAMSFNGWISGIPTTGAPPSVGAFGVFSTLPEDVIVDVVGYWSPANPPTISQSVIGNPVRVVDTRGAPVGPIGFQPNGSPIVAGAAAGNTSTPYRLSGQSFVGPNGLITLPNDLKGALVKVTTVGGVGGGYVTLYPGDVSPAPTAATVLPTSVIAGTFGATGLPTAGPNAGSFNLYTATGPLDFVVELLAVFR